MQGRIAGELSAADRSVALEMAADRENIYPDVLRQASFRQIDVMELVDCAAKLKAVGRTTEALALYEAWIASNNNHALLWAVYFNYSVVLAETNDLPRSIHALRTTIRLNPGFGSAYINLGSLLDRQGRSDEAVAEWTALVTMFAPVTGSSVHFKTMALNQMGRVLASTPSSAEAEENLRQSLDIDPNQSEVVGHLIALRQRQCKWPSVVASERITEKNLIGAMPPLVLANHSDDAMFQLARAYHFNKLSVGVPTVQELTRGTRLRSDMRQKLRIGYVSSDLRAHAVGFAMTDVFETHDRDRFETFAYYCGIGREDDTKARIRRAADHWIDISAGDSVTSAARIAADGIDILVDLNGYSKDARTRVFALRPAPIAINWFGFPGTMATPYHHYLIADDYIVPPDHEIYYSEKVLRLPCYQPNDRKRVVSDQRPTRQDVGLPEAGFVFCCLNGMQKLTSLVFGRWMQILRQVSNSVLWLLEGDAQTNERVRKLAEQDGVAPERVVFADRLPNPEHLARYALADLFLDTLPYGAHTTASDALWMGLPILTLSGRSFASRVCGSIVRSAGLPELICSSADDYVDRAIMLGHDRSQVVNLRRRLLDARQSCLLFDTPTLVGSLEALYCQIWSEFVRGERAVPDLSNLETYHEIGLTLDLEKSELLSEASYRALYRQKVADSNAVAPFGPDGRFWQPDTNIERF
jgi:predicted O-linked N-acetylglucosamine transferase (SPINDLY family)